YAPDGRHSRGRFSHGIRLRHRPIRRPNPGTEPSEGSPQPGILQLRTKQPDLQRHPILEEHWKRSDQPRKLLRERLDLQPVREDHVDWPALDNPDDAGTSSDSNLLGVQLHQYWRRVHVLDRKLLHDNTVILS